MAAPTPIQIEALREVSPRRATGVILIASAAALAMLFVVIFGHGRAQSAPAWVGRLPALNALLNGTSAVLLVFAYLAIRRRDVVSHSRLMLGALASSALFLVSYIVYHSIHGDSRFAGHGAVRPIYFVVLVTHVVLSGVALPLIFSSFFLSLSGRLALHKKVSRYTLPLWLYVSVTGVVVYAMLRAYT